MFEDELRHQVAQEAHLVVGTRIEWNKMIGDFIRTRVFHEVRDDTTFPLARLPSDREVAPCWYQRTNGPANRCKFLRSSNEALPAALYQAIVVNDQRLEALIT
jgi:hypothetical protein